MEQPAQDIPLKIQLFPFSNSGSVSFIFAPVELYIRPYKVFGIGRKIDKTKQSYREMSREDRALNNVHSSTDDACINFRSKVVSRSHAEMWLGKDDGQVSLLVLSIILSLFYYSSFI